jgi:hypothetical protein
MIEPARSGPMIGVVLTRLPPRRRRSERESQLLVDALAAEVMCARDGYEIRTLQMPRNDSSASIDGL